MYGGQQRFTAMARNRYGLYMGVRLERLLVTTLLGVGLQHIYNVRLLGGPGQTDRVMLLSYSTESVPGKCDVAYLMHCFFDQKIYQQDNLHIHIPHDKKRRAMRKHSDSTRTKMNPISSHIALRLTQWK